MRGTPAGTGLPGVFIDTLSSTRGTPAGAGLLGVFIDTLSSTRGSPAAPPAVLVLALLGGPFLPPQRSLPLLVLPALGRHRPTEEAQRVDVVFLHDHPLGGHHQSRFAEGSFRGSGRRLHTCTLESNLCNRWYLLFPATFNTQHRARVHM